VLFRSSVDALLHPEIAHNIYDIDIGAKEVSQTGVLYQLRKGNSSGANLLSIITKSSYSEWSKWENTKSGARGRDYEERKMSIAQELLGRAGNIFGNLQRARILDVFTPLTLRDYVNCAEGSCYGIMRSTSQLLKIVSLNNVPVPGLFLAGQNALAPGVLGSILGSFNAARQIAGAECLIQKFKLDSHAG
jgi:all-trans-retinol 13,14-reductase